MRVLHPAWHQLSLKEPVQAYVRDPGLVDQMHEKLALVPNHVIGLLVCVETPRGFLLSPSLPGTRRLDANLPVLHFSPTAF